MKNSKFEARNSKQAQNGFGNLNLGFVWDLEFGIWLFYVWRRQ